MNPAHRDDVRRTLIGLLTVGVGSAIAYVGMTVQSGGELPLKDYTTVQATFSDVGTLKPQQKVTENGVRIGLVTDIEYAGSAAQVTMRLDGDRTVYQDASARIGNESALGKKYIDFDPGTPQAGEAESLVLTAAQTHDAADLNNVLEAFDPKARAGLAAGLQSLGGGLSGHGRDLRDLTGHADELLRDGRTVVGTLADPATNLDDLLVTADSLARQFQGQSDQVAALLEQGTTTLRAVNVDGSQPLQRTLAELPAVLTTARKGLRALNGPLATTASAAVELRPGVGRLVAAVPDLRGFLVESPPVARTVVRFTDEAEPAVKALVPAVRDARPLVARVERALGLSAPFLTDLLPYWQDVAGLAANHNLLSGHFTPTRHYFSAMLAFPGVYNVSLPDPTVDVAPYPGPGEALARTKK